jgi:hypothetical protein
MLCGCSNQNQLPTPENAEVILLCTNVLQTNEHIQIAYRLDEVIKGSINPKMLDESNFINGLTGPYFDDLNVPQKSFIFARSKAETPDVASFIVKHERSELPVYDESILKHKNDIQFLQSEFERRLKERNNHN